MNTQEYLVTCLAEEGSEITKAATKVLRFGWYDHHPKTGDIYNIDLLQQELVDLVAVLEILKQDHKSNLTEIPEDKLALKKEKIYQYIAYAKERGTLIEE